MDRGEPAGIVLEVDLDHLTVLFAGHGDIIALSDPL
tara:strand:- start:101327 stop:101434 length:108 start_codon:yes stop_codon:yes gene_type:complete